MAKQGDHSTSSTPGVSRRAALGLALAAGAASVPLAATAGTSSSTPAGALTRDRKRQYTALVEAVGSLPGTRVKHAESGRAADTLAKHYEAAPRSAQQLVDGALDSIGTDGSFSAMGSAERLAYLRKRLDDESTGSLRLARGSRVTEAIALATAPFDPRGFSWSLEAAELWIMTLRLYDPS